MRQELEREDIQTRADIETLVEAFYTRAMADPLIGPIFVDVAKLDLAAHMPVMCDFWENILFGARKYPGGMMMVHFQLHAKTALAPNHFQRWLDHWLATVNELFAGDRATLAMQHAARVAGVMAGRFQEMPGGPPPPSDVPA